MKKNKKELQIVSLLKSIDCKILVYGNKKAKIDFYYCNCDPEQKDAICAECARICHKGHRISAMKYGLESCKCGIRCHKIDNISAVENFKYTPKCLFHKWSEYSKKNVFYIHKNLKICMFCRNFCKENLDENDIIKVSMEEIPECMCNHSNHLDMISILDKMNYIFYLDEYDFDELMKTQLFNLIFKSKECFDNLYQNFVIVLNILKKKLKQLDFSLDIHFQMTNISFAIKNFSTLINSIKHFYYFDNKVKDYFDSDFLLDLMKKKFNYNITSIWQLKANVLNIFRKGAFLSDFMFCPFFKVRDIINMNPLIRMILCSNIKEDEIINNKYLNKKVYSKTDTKTTAINFIDSIIAILYKFLSVSQVLNEKYTILQKLYGVIKVFAKYNLLELHHIHKVCEANDEILYRFKEYREYINFSESTSKRADLLKEITKYENMILVPMIKSLIFITFYSNDLQIVRYLKEELDLQEVKYFHYNNQLSKTINRNLVNILNFSKQYYDKKSEDNDISTIYQKNLKKILNYSLDMISFTLNYPDTYILPFRTLLGGQTSHYMKCLLNDFSQNEREFIEFIKKESKEIEEKYFQFFQMDININEVKDFVKASVIKFFQFIKSTNYQPVKGNISDLSSKEEDNFKEIHNFQNIFVVNKAKTKKFNIYPKGDTTFTQENLLYEVKKKTDIQQKSYKILMNKSFYTFTVIKVLKIIFEFDKKMDQKTKTDIEEDLFDEILRLLYFYTENNSENCVVILSSDFAYTFTSIDKRKFIKLIDFYVNCLKTLKEKNHKFSTNKTIFIIIKNLILDILNKAEDRDNFIPKILKMLKLFMDIPSLDSEKTFKDLKRLLMNIHSHINIFTEYKNFLVKRNEKKKNPLEKIKESSLEHEQSYRSRNKWIFCTLEEDKKDENCTSIIEDEKKNLLTKVKSKLHESSRISKFKTNNEKLRKDLNVEKEEIKRLMTSKQGTTVVYDLIKVVNKKLSSSKPSNSNLIPIDNSQEEDITDELEEKNKISNVISKLFVRFLKLINSSFDLVCDMKENMFLKGLLSLDDISEILRNYELDLTIRIEILKFFKLAYFNQNIEETQIKKYISMFVNLPNEKGEGFGDEYENLRFYDNLLQINERPTNLTEKFNIIRLELKYYPLVLSNLKNRYNTEMIITYLEEGIIIPLFHFMNIFLSKIFVHTGYEYLQLYEILYYFLNLKIFIFENKHIFEKYVEMEKKDYFQEFHIIHKTKRFLLINSSFELSEFSELEDDFREISSDRFEIFNYKLLLSKINKHLFDFIHKQKSKSLIKYFSKVREQYSEGKIEIIKMKLKEGDYLRNDLDNKVFDLIIKYENEKQNLHKSKFMKVLSEKFYNKNYRFILYKILFYLINIEKKEEKFFKQNLFNILKLMQFDTKGSQEDIKIIFSNHTLDHKILIDKLIKNLVIIIFYNSDPSLTKINQSYILAVNIIKIFKYLCEDHNNYFQRIMFNKIKLEYIPQGSNITKESSFVDFFLLVLMKIIVIAKWECVKIGDDENNVSYFYDIFFVIVEFLIEIVQGTKRENLETLLVQHSEIERTAFSLFLIKIRKLLLSNKNDSNCLYRIRKVLIDFIMSFLEEKNTPSKIINIIYNFFYPYAILTTIVNTMKKLFLKYKQQEEKISIDVSNYKKMIFDDKMYEYFRKKFYYDQDFINMPEFELSNRMYQYIKLLALEYSNDDALIITESINTIKEIEVREDIKNDTRCLLDDGMRVSKKFHFMYYCIKFFEDITRAVYVYKDEEKQTVRILFTINPLTIHLSTSTKVTFEQNVNRQTRYSKISYLLENCNYFFDEILYNYEHFKKGYLNRFFIQIDYHFFESLMFFLTFIINIFMILFLHLDDDSSDNSSSAHRYLGSSSTTLTGSSSSKLKTFGNTQIDDIIYSMTILNIVLNLAIVVCWFINKYTLSYILEKRMFLLKKTKKSKLNLFERFKLSFFYPVIRRNEINSFIWNIFFSSLVIYSPDRKYLYSLQILCIINLSPNLKNIVKAVTLRYKQLILAWVFIIITTFIFACFGYFLFYDYWDNHGEAEFCRSLIGCFLMNLNLGLREHGGAGDLLKQYSIIHLEQYMANFFYCLLYRIICMYILEEIVVGITIDTFAEIREHTIIKEHDISSICFICGGNRDDLEKKGNNFDNHRIKEHNVWNYADYIIGLKFVDPQETNAINSYVINMIENNSIIWFPAFKNSDEEEIK